jgi:predicted DNA-binding transcriptional regulator YafY
VERDFELEQVAALTRAPLWRLRPDDRPRKIGLRRAQAYAFLAARRLFEPMRGSALFDEIDLALRSVLTLANRPGRGPNAGVVDAHLEDRFVYFPADPVDYSARTEEVDVLYHAVADLRPVHCRYRPPFGEERTIILHPFGMVLYRDAIYAVGSEQGVTTIEVFPLEDLYDASVTNAGRFDLPEGFDLNDFYQGRFGLWRAESRVRVVVDFDASAAHEVRKRRFHPTQRLSAQRGGGVRLTMFVSDVERVASWVLAFGSRVRVVEPDELRKLVIRELRGAVARYRDRSPSGAH